MREWAKIELGERDTAQVVAAVRKWTASLDPQEKDYEHHMMEALWVHQWHNAVDLPLLARMLESPEPRARAAAARVLCYWRDRVPNSLAQFKKLALDEHPRVRLEAVRAASFYPSAEAAEVALAVLKHPMDYYLDYTLKETLRQLAPWWRKAISEGRPLAADNPAGIDHLIKSVGNTELLKMPRTPAVLESILSRDGISDSDRNVALDAIAKLRNTPRVNELLRLLDAKSSTDPSAVLHMARLLPLQSSSDLKPMRANLSQLSLNGSSSELRQSAWSALALADGGFDQTWQDASHSPRALSDLVQGIPLLTDPDFRAKAYDRVTPLLHSIPETLKSAAASNSSAATRFVRIEIPRNATLTLAEVEVFSEGRNVARQGKARQSSTSNGGEASRAIDGRTDGSFTSGTQTHSIENEPNPWWEVDLGSELPVDSVVVWNRTDDQLGRRLDGYTLTLLDRSRQEVLKKTKNPAPAPSQRIPVGGDPIGALRRGAIRASVSMNREPASVFEALGEMIARGELVSAAAEGIRSIPRSAWPKAKAGEVATSLVSWAKNIPTGERTAQDFVETIQFAEDITGLLPPEKALGLRKELRTLRVPVFVIRAVREQMRYDTPRIVVETGKAVEIIFENADFMPHNLAIVRPGTREKVGLAASLMKPDQLDGRGRAYIPDTTDVMSATKLIESGQRVVLSITVPNEEAEMEYVCTFPGHHQLMWGRFVVTRDVDAYLQAHPEAPVPVATSPHIHE